MLLICRFNKELPINWIRNSTLLARIVRIHCSSAQSFCCFNKLIWRITCRLKSLSNYRILHVSNMHQISVVKFTRPYQQYSGLCNASIFRYKLIYRLIASFVLSNRNYYFSWFCPRLNQCVWEFMLSTNTYISNGWL